MTQTKRQIIVRVMLICISFLVFDLRAADVIKQPQAQTKDAAQVQALAEAELRIKALKDEIQIFKDFTQNVLSTVYFALSTVIIVVVAMLGFSWYQNFKVYERDKEALRESLVSIINQHLGSQEQQLRARLDAKAISLEDNMKSSVQSLDSKITQTLNSVLARMNNDSLSNKVELFTATHFGKTVETDFMMLCQHVRGSIGKVHASNLKHALSTIIQHVEEGGVVDHTTLMEIAVALPPELEASATRLRSLIDRKS